MFKNDKKIQSVNGTAQKTPSLNMISEDTRIKGSINSQTDIRIAGRLEGEIFCKGKCIITGSAKLDGNLTTVDADIAGTITGTIKISNKLILRQSAKINGDIYTKTLIVEEGAVMNGGCRMGSADQMDSIKESDFVTKRKTEQM
ncbi:MAG: polymer-forming cytoskeletal protein [Balneolaceae bacterium]